MNKNNKKTKFLRLSVIIVFLLSLFAMAGSASAMPHMYYRFNRQASQTLDQGATINGPGLFAGDFIQIDGDINGTTFASGDQVQVNGDINGALFFAGDTIQINGEVNGNIYGLGNRIQMRGQNEGDVFFAGRNVVVEQDSRSGRDLFIAGMNVVVDGPVPRHLFAVGEFVTLNGEIGGDATVNSEELTVGQSAAIEGDLRYESPNEATISPTASVAGQTDYTERDTWERQWNVTQQERWQFRLLYALWSLLAALVVWVMIKLLKPHFWSDTTVPIGSEPLKTLGFGLLALIATPFVAMLLMITVIGIPMGIILVMLYGIALYISKIIVALFIGSLILKSYERERFGKEFLLVLIGLVILELLMLIPYVGWVFGTIIVIAGLGALILFRRGTDRVKYEET